MDIQLLTFENQMSAFKNYLTSFGNDVSDAMENANKFYDAIAGAQGLIKWVSTNTPGFSVVSDLCRLSSPNWCEFSKVRRLFIFYFYFFFIIKFYDCHFLLLYIINYYLLFINI